MLQKERQRETAARVACVQRITAKLGISPTELDSIAHAGCSQIELQREPRARPMELSVHCERNPCGSLVPLASRERGSCP